MPAKKSKKPAAKKAPAKKAPAKKIAVKKPAPKAVKKPAAKAVKKPLIKKPAPKPVKKAAAKPASKPTVKAFSTPSPARIAATVASKPLWPTTPAPARPHNAYTPAQPARAVFEWSDYLKLTFAYFWRSYSLMIPYGVIAAVLLMSVEDRLTQNQLGAVTFGVMLGVIALAIYMQYWMLTAPSLSRSLRLRLTPHLARPVPQVLGLWFSYTWRNILLTFPLFYASLVLRAWGNMNGYTAPYLITEFDIIVGCFELLILPLVTGSFVWYWLLKKRTFGWGVLELTRIKG